MIRNRAQVSRSSKVPPPPGGSARQSGGGESGKPDNRWRDRLELVSTLLLALASVLTAWSAFQASKWNGIQQLSLGDANSARTEAVAELNLLANSISVDAGLWLSWLDARLGDRPEVADYLEGAFEDPLLSAFNRWQASDPLTATDAPPTPFEEELYFAELGLGGSFDDLTKAIDAADGATERARQANQNSDNYVLATVLVSMTLFFAGISSKFRQVRSQAILVGLGSATLVASVVVLVLLPKVL